MKKMFNKKEKCFNFFFQNKEEVLKFVTSKITKWDPVEMASFVFEISRAEEKKIDGKILDFDDYLKLYFLKTPFLKKYYFRIGL